MLLSARSVRGTPLVRSGPVGLASSAMSSSLECGPAAWETWGIMSTSPAIVSIGEPLIEFNRPKDGDGRTWLQGFGGDSQNVAIAAARQGAGTGYLTRV